MEDHVQGILAGDRGTLARTITLVESNAPAHFNQAQAVLGRLMKNTGNSIRIGITGVPGAGKSSLIEVLGSLLVEQEHQVAVLAIDPTSQITGGSIMGDKTRMSRLSQHPNAFIRPSPTGGVLGGVARKTRETMLICEAAGFDVVLVETVGTGQSEVTVRSMVDFLLLMAITGAGDELQGLKKGIIEIADAIVINKADGDNKLRTQAARAEYNRALHYLTPVTDGWRLQAYTCSALTGEGVADIWSMIETFRRFHSGERCIRPAQTPAKPRLALQPDRAAVAARIFRSSPGPSRAATNRASRCNWAAAGRHGCPPNPGHFSPTRLIFTRKRRFCSCRPVPGYSGGG